MTVQYLELGGEQRPLLFAFAAFYQYELETGRNATTDILSLADGQMSVMIVVDLTFAALVAGHKKERTEIDFDVNDVAAWLSDDIGLVNRIMTLIGESMPKPKEQPKKKAKGVKP